MTNIVAIVEGVERSLLNQQVESGTLPWFKNAINTGHYYQLDTGPVPYEPSNLASAFSGVGPGHHGCFSYWEIHNQHLKPRVLDANDVKVPRVWEWKELEDCKFSVVNVQLTHPPKPINGNLISYLMQQSLHATYPPELQKDLNKRGIRYAHDVSMFYNGETADKFAYEILRIAKYQLNAALEIGKDCDLLIINLTAADRLSHFLWSEIENNNTLNRLPYIIQSYQFIDAALKKLETLLNSNDSMMVFSEIGFGHINHFVSLDAQFQAMGMQNLDSAGEVSIDKSLAREAVQGSHGINLINQNKVSNWAPGNSLYEAQQNEICQALLNMTFEDGTSIIESVKIKEELYPGPYMHLAPDIVVKPADPARPPLGDPRWAKHVHRHLQTGWHRDGGFCIMSNKNHSYRQVETAHLESIAPTIATMLNRDCASHCKEESLLQ